MATGWTQHCEGNETCITAAANATVATATISSGGCCCDGGVSGGSGSGVGGSRAYTTLFANAAQSSAQRRFELREPCLRWQQPTAIAGAVMCGTISELRAELKKWTIVQGDDLLPHQEPYLTKHPIPEIIRPPKKK